MSKYDSFDSDYKSPSRVRWLLLLLLLLVTVGAALYLGIPQKVMPQIKAMIGLDQEQGGTELQIPVQPGTQSAIPGEASKQVSSDAGERAEESHQLAMAAMRSASEQDAATAPSFAGGGEVTAEMADLNALIEQKRAELAKSRDDRRQMKEDISALQVEIEQSNLRIDEKKQQIEALQAR